MNMPEGWKTLVYKYRHDPEEINRAMDLMKEMAEALEFVSSSSNCCEYRDNCDAIKNVLKKFKEWK